MSFDIQKTVQFVLRELEDADNTRARQNYMRVQNVHMACSTADVLGFAELLPTEKLTAEVMGCFNAKSGLFSAYVGGDAHILYTLNALQALVTLGKMDLLRDKAADIARGVKALRQGGDFLGDLVFREQDSRFVFSGVAALFILWKHFGDAELWLQPTEVEEIHSGCKALLNADGGMGCAPGQESHAINLFCVCSTLKLLGRLDVHALRPSVQYLIQRQTASGGFNGRPEKLQDSCYAQWCGVPLQLLKIHFNEEMLRQFLLSCWDPESGGFADRPENEPDLFHTHFAVLYLAGAQANTVLSLRSALVDGWFAE